MYVCGWLAMYMPHNLFKYWTEKREICYKYSLRYGGEHCQVFKKIEMTAVVSLVKKRE